MKESDRLAFNKQFKTLLTAAKAWAKAGKDLDDALLKLHTVLEKAHVRKDIMTISYLHMDVITKRQ